MCRRLDFSLGENIHLIPKLSQEKELIEEDTTRLSKELQRVVEDCNRMQEQNSNLLEKLKGASSKEEIKSMMEEIQALQTELIQREDALFKAERALKEKQAELEERNAKITELTKLLEERDNYLNSLKDKVMKALAPFESEGLKVYVSMDEKLLFQSGRWVVDAKGVNAIRELSKVLATTKDVDIVVEGHTDNVPYTGSGNILDNWDLSVKRATSIVRILLENKDIDPTKVSASGRSEYCPIETANTKEARQANRRIEIILTPNLDELLKIFE